MNTVTADNARKVAAEWRATNHESQAGVVLVWEGMVYGWKDSLRDAQHERPGAIAVDDSGQVFVALGGNDYDGAESWKAEPPGTL